MHINILFIEVKYINNKIIINFKVIIYHFLYIVYMYN